MRGLCKTKCGNEIEFEPHEFSDGFVYYLPRNLDHTPHQCVIFNAVEECYQDPDPDMEEFYQENKTRLKITQEKFNELINDAFADPVSFLDSVFDTDNMDMLRKGKMFELKKHIENNLNVLSNPFFMSRAPDNGTGQNAPVEMSIFSSKVNVEELLNFIPLILPTGLGYQLEYLGHAYELMIRLEDAKKCYELQYECTKEPELLEISKELDKKIQERKSVEEITKNVPNNLTSEDMWKKINSTQSNVKKYVVELFSNNFTEVFKRNLKIKNQTEKIRRKDEESLLKINEKHVMDNVGLGDLLHILKTSKTKRKSKFSGKCKICGTYYERHQDIFLEDNPKRIMCADEICFVKQGGVSKNIPWALINRIENINNLRNALAHPRDFDKEWLRIHFIEAYVQCIMVNKEILDFFKNKEST